ncbi:YfiR family protein [Pseudomonas sp. NFXW11]|uniref:YfiR family protein n=1 Tax=Pseudomonas sp. NFXW11 TaxID=2819531 RepID=UPI003CF0F315
MDVAVSKAERILRWRQCALATLLCLFSLLAAAQPEPQASASLAEQRAKAVTQVVLGILSYARWPVEPAQLRLCVVGPTEYTDDLLKGATQATGRPVLVRRLLASNGTIASECDSVYVGKLGNDERTRLFSSLTGQPVLSISEGGDQCTVGSLFCLRVSDNQVSFEVNLDSVARSGVRIHPSVLQLSRRRPATP